MIFNGKYPYLFECSTSNNPFKRNFFANEPKLYFDTYGFPTLNLRYLNEFFGSKIKKVEGPSKRDPSFEISGKEDEPENRKTRCSIS